MPGSATRRRCKTLTSSTSDYDLTPEARTRRLELLDVATGLAEEGVEPVDVARNSIEVERGAVEAVPTSLLAFRPFSDNSETTVITDNFSLSSWCIRFLPAGDDDVLEARHAAPVLAAIDGTAYFAKAELRAEYGLYSSPSRVSYDMEDGRIRRGSGHPEEKARKVYDAAQQL
ncbi:hypothetical protein SAMN05216355_101549 [Actinomyces ruminicola]|uniref:Uncharacterized protein n=1 Tax=Actinomyces ruminicola TaxID=332524 RepID=A0A1H0A440_9ACTO|nr:hypothetical protein [Actinomyces ruminicola]SDN28014.1 hypothetical protein SAMN05216355_101549 [Actinomyces ruminicola]